PTMASLEMMDQSDAGFTDERAGGPELFLSESQWWRALARAEGECVLTLPEDAAEMAAHGMRVFLARFKTDRAAVRDTVLMEFLRKRLPAHMAPSRLQFLDSMPLTSNGKTDLQRLAEWVPQPAVAVPDRPVTALAAKLMPLWSEVLAVSAVDPDRGFLEL